MNPADVANAVRLILDGKGRPVTLHLRRIPGWRDTVEITAQVPTGRFVFAYATVGTYTDDITIDELRGDLKHAARELTTRQIAIAA